MEKSLSIVHICKDFLFLFVLLFSTFYIVYFGGQDFAKVYFLLLLFLFFLSKRDYLWFAYFIIVISQPGWLFSDFSGASTTRLPMYTIAKGLSFTPIDFFWIIALVKALFFGRKHNFILKRPLAYLFTYGVFLILVSFLIYGTGQDSIIYSLRNALPLTLIISFIYLVHKSEEIRQFTYLVLPITLFILFTQIYGMYYGDEFVNILSPGSRSYLYLESGILRLEVGGTVLVFLSYIFSLYGLAFGHGKMRRSLLWLIVFVCYISIFLSATRVWFVMFSVILFFYFLFAMGNMRRLLRISVIMFIGAILIVNFKPFQPTFMGSWARMSEIGSVAQGRFSDAPTFEGRVFERLPVLMAALRQNWIIGWGFSDMYLNYADPHVGNFNLLLQAGLIGFFLFGYFWFRFFRLTYDTIRRLPAGNAHRTSLLVISLAMVAMLIAHFSTYMFFNFAPGIGNATMISIIICLLEVTVRDANRGRCYSAADVP